MDGNSRTVGLRTRLSIYPARPSGTRPTPDRTERERSEPGEADRARAEQKRGRPAGGRDENTRRGAADDAAPDLCGVENGVVLRGSTLTVVLADEVGKDRKPGLRKNAAAPSRPTNAVPKPFEPSTVAVASESPHSINVDPAVRTSPRRSERPPIARTPMLSASARTEAAPVATAGDSPSPVAKTTAFPMIMRPTR